jgi:hypothetical protein
VAKTGPIEYLCNPVDGAKIDALIADLYRMPKMSSTPPVSRRALARDRTGAKLPNHRRGAADDNGTDSGIVEAKSGHSDTLLIST